MFGYTTMLPVLFLGLASAQAQNTTLDLSWHAPNKTWINDLSRVINDTGVNGFIFNSSKVPEGVKYGTYNWCNMPHVRRQEYPRASREYQLQYVEVIHRHHKRTPYADNTFPRESYGWSCSDQGNFYYGQPLNPNGNPAAASYWNISQDAVNPFAQRGFNGSCQFPQITREGLDDSFQHGKDLYGVYGDLLDFIPEETRRTVSFRVTSNVITSQVAGMAVQGMFDPETPYPLLIEPDNTDALQPTYSCPASSSVFGSFGVGSSTPAWTAHLSASQPLFNSLDAISGVPPTDSGFHRSWDHYFDNLSARQCHAKPLPCQIGNSANCVTQQQADAVYRLGQLEYSYIYRDASQSLAASTSGYGLWLAQLAQHIRNSIDGTSPMLYRHNVAHDGSVSRLLSILQLDVMVWPGMGSEVVFELYKKKGAGNKRFLRILWSGQILRSSNPTLGFVDMLDVDVFLAYVDGLVGARASKIVGLCAST